MRSSGANLRQASATPLPCLGVKPKCGRVWLQTSMKIFVYPEINAKYGNRTFIITRQNFPHKFTSQMVQMPTTHPRTSYLPASAAVGRMLMIE